MEGSSKVNIIKSLLASEGLGASLHTAAARYGVTWHKKLKVIYESAQSL